MVFGFLTNDAVPYRRRREKLQAHLKESRSQKNYNLNSSSLAPKPSLRPQQGLQLQKVSTSGPFYTSH